MREELENAIEEMAEDDYQRDRMLLIADKILAYSTNWMGGKEDEFIITEDDIVQIAFDLEQEI